MNNQLSFQNNITTLSHEKIAWMRLARSKNIGSRSIMKLIELYRTPSQIIAHLQDLARNHRAKILITAEKDIQKELQNVEKFGAKILTPFDPDYPVLLNEIIDFPLALTVKGDLSILKKKAIAIIGSRNASISGCKFALNIAQKLCDDNLCVVSGLALGIDAAAHQGALRSKTPATVAVIAGGINSIYPKENTALYNKIAEEGVIMTENSYDTLLHPNHFPRRNRIVSGLSLGVLVVEASEKSGSLITARLALEQGREVFAVPNHPSDPRSLGVNSLIKQGAIMVSNYQDIIDELQVIKVQEEFYENIKVFKEKPINIYELQIVRDKIMSLLSTVPVDCDELLLAIGCDAPILHQALVELELAGAVQRDEMNKWMLS